VRRESVLGREGQREAMASWALLALVLGFLAGAARASEPWTNGTQVYYTNGNSGGGNGAFVGLTLIQSAAARGAGKSLLLQQLFPVYVSTSIFLDVAKISFLLAMSRGMGY
jgi:hypothetical protein